MAGAALPWWQTGVVYQVYPRSFQDTNGDGVGDLPGVTARLDHLASLGVDALWLSPFYPSPMKDFGYDVSDFTGVDPIFGTLGDFDRLVAAAHARGLRVVVDWVPNHTSDQHPWFLASRASRHGRYRDFYVWRDGRPGGAPPNNWLSAFGGPAWTLDRATGQWYLHSFLPEQPDLNWRNPEVRREMLATLAFWLARGVDGFRVDVAAAVMKDPDLRDNPPAPPGRRAMHKDMGEYGTQAHVHDRGHPDAHALYREVRRLLDGWAAGEDKVSIGEIHLFDPIELVAWYGADLDELHMPFNFTLLGVPWTAAAVGAAVEAMEAALPPGAWPSWVLGNHDESRVATRLGEEEARTAMLVLLTLRGTPTIYQGDELGLPDVPIPPEEIQDPWGRNVPGLGRDPARTPMPWDGSENAGFTAPGVRPWLRLGDGASARSVAAQAADPGSMLSLTRRLLAVRRGHPALSRGSWTRVPAPDGVLAFERAHEADRVVVLAALDLPRPVRVPLGARAGTAIAATGGGEGRRIEGALDLAPREGIAVALER